MKLKYRGVAYNYDPINIAMVKGKVGGKYRGVTWQQKIPLVVRVDEPSVELKYRGVTYRKGAVKLPKAKAEPEKDLVTL